MRVHIRELEQHVNLNGLVLHSQSPAILTLSQFVVARRHSRIRLCNSLFGIATELNQCHHHQ